MSTERYILYLGDNMLAPILDLNTITIYISTVVVIYSPLYTVVVNINVAIVDVDTAGYSGAVKCNCSACGF